MAEGGPTDRLNEKVPRPGGRKLAPTAGVSDAGRSPGLLGSTSLVFKMRE